MVNICDVVRDWDVGGELRKSADVIDVGSIDLPDSEIWVPDSLIKVPDSTSKSRLRI